MTEDNHEIRELRHRLKLANRTMGKQGRTIRSLRGELALVREEHSKIERGDLRRLERFEETALEQFALDKERLERAHEEIKRLREKLDAPTDVVSTPAGAREESVK
jgi:hypothetical protein